MLVEQFKLSLPRHIEIHLNELGITELRKAAMAADSYELTHKEAPWKGRFGRQDRRPVATDRPVETPTVKPPVTHVLSQPPGERFEKPYFPRTDVICHYCRKPGHIKSSCPGLKRKNGDGRIVGLISSQTHSSPSALGATKSTCRLRGEGV